MDFIYIKTVSFGNESIISHKKGDDLKINYKQKWGVRKHKSMNCMCIEYLLNFYEIQI